MTQTGLELELDLGAETIRCTAEEVAHALAGLLREMRAAAPFVTPEERETLRFIMSHPSGALTVGDLFPDFDRHSAALTALRRLRTAQFIRPAGRDHWEAGEHIEIKPFARLLWARLGEAAIFGDAPAEREHEQIAIPSDEEAAIEPAVGSEDVDLSLPEVNEPDGAETIVPKGKKRATAWDEADVLEFLNDDEPSTLKGEVA
ncbi:MAG: hypothetical protein J0I06_24795 [Planctomycetes bacterium]|nr:hypothetical protein [Planctomycetota bacterium]